MTSCKYLLHNKINVTTGNTCRIENGSSFTSNSLATKYNKLTVGQDKVAVYQELIKDKSTRQNKIQQELIKDISTSQEELKKEISIIKAVQSEFK